MPPFLALFVWLFSPCFSILSPFILWQPLNRNLCFIRLTLSKEKTPIPTLTLNPGRAVCNLFQPLIGKHGRSDMWPTGMPIADKGVSTPHR